MVTTACFFKENYEKPQQHIVIQRHHFVNQGPVVKAMVISVALYRCENRTIKKAEH